MRSPRTYPKGGKEESRVGIFWLANGKLLIDSTPLDEAERYGDFVTHPRGHGACGKDHFFVGRDILHFAVCYYSDAHAKSTFEVQFHHVGVEQQSEVRPRQRWAQEGANGAHASAIRRDVHVDVAGTGTHRSVRAKVWPPMC